MNFSDDELRKMRLDMALHCAKDISSRLELVRGEIARLDGDSAARHRAKLLLADCYEIAEEIRELCEGT